MNDIFTIYGAFTTVDEVGRNGKCLGWFSTRQAALKAATGHGWYGGNGNVDASPAINFKGQIFRLVDKTPVAVDDSDEKREAIKQQALAKLTDAEREALGFEKQKGQKT